MRKTSDPVGMTGLDYFGARYFSGAQGRFTSPGPKMLSSQRLQDPQQWNMYSYVRNNPAVAIDPDGKEMTIVVVNHSNVRHDVVAAAARDIRTNYQAAGVQNVKVQFAAEVPNNVLRDSGVDPHTVYLEFQTNHNGQVQIASGADGQNPPQTMFGGPNSLGGPGGSAAGVEAAAKGVQSDKSLELVNNLSAVGTHETAHKYLSGTPTGEEHPENIMNHGQEPLRNVPFTPNQAQKLRDVLNTLEEKTKMEQPRQ